MSPLRFRSILPLFPALLLLLSLLSCEDTTTDPDDDMKTDTTDVDTSGVGGENGNLAPRGSSYEVEVEWEYEDPAFTDRTESNSVRVEGKLRDYAGRSNVLLYAMPAGFVTDYVFHGNLTELSNGKFALYYTGNMMSDLKYWRFQGWVEYPLSGAKVSSVLHDSTNSSGTRRQRVTWSAEPGGAESIVVKGKTYSGELVFWEMQATRWSNGVVEQELLYSGEDLWIPELAYVAERYVETEADGVLWLTTIATLVDHDLPTE